MKIKDAREHYGYNTGKTSELIRQLGLAGIALVWIFKAGSPDNPTIPNHLLRVLAYLAFALGADLFQYIAGSAFWGIFQWYKGDYQQRDDDEEVRAPGMINWLQILFFWIKVLLISRGYYLLLKFLYYKLYPC